MSPTFSSPEPAAVGRPRDAALDQAILRAAMELVGESGIASVTMDSVAQRVGASKASLYRRWKSKDELLVDALQLYLPGDISVDTGTLRGDLLTLYAHYYGFGDQVIQTAVQEFLINLHEHLTWSEKVVPERLKIRRAMVQGLFERAVARGEIEAPADMGLLLNLVPAMVLYRSVTPRQKVTRAFIVQLVDDVVLPLIKRTVKSAA